MDQNKVARDRKGHKELRDTADLRNKKNATKTAKTRRNRRKLGPQPQVPRGTNKMRKY